MGTNGKDGWNALVYICMEEAGAIQILSYVLKASGMTSTRGVKVKDDM